MEAWLYYVWALVLVLGCTAAWLSNLVGMPGNWLVAGLAALFAWLVSIESVRGVSWTAIAVLVGLAGLGEVAEFATSAAGAAKEGASKRSVALAMVGAFAGGIIGIGMGAPILIVGPFVMAIVGGAAGAFFGAYLGEAWKGRPHEARVAVGRGAFTGRIWGTVAKLAVGAIMLVIVAWDAFFN